MPRDGTNIAVEAFGRIGDPGRVAFTMRSQIPPQRRMGSSAAARVAGAVAAFVMGGEEPLDALAPALDIATELEGHADNATAAVLGGVTVELPDGPLRLSVPQRLAFVLVAPHEAVSTPAARAALPSSVLARRCGVQRRPGDGARRRTREPRPRPHRAGPSAIALHQPHRAHLYPRSMDLIASAADLGALGATVSGAGPEPSCSGATATAVRDVEHAAREWSGDWATVLGVDPSERGAQVERL